MCYWHCAVFERHYRRLVIPDVICRETACAAAGADACLFVLRRG
ncbi:V4R domain-containing protein [Roseobacter sp. HKCC-CH-9351]